MKATGIVRRVDDLGRIVMPKEIRRDTVGSILHWNAGSVERARAGPYIETNQAALYLSFSAEKLSQWHELDMGNA